MSSIAPSPTSHQAAMSRLSISSPRPTSRAIAAPAGSMTRPTATSRNIGRSGARHRAERPRASLTPATGAGFAPAPLVGSGPGNGHGGYRGAAIFEEHEAHRPQRSGRA